MNKLILIILLLSSLAWAGGQKIAHLTIYSSSDDIEIRLNSALLGKTPIQKLSLQEGHYIIEAVNKNSGVWSAENVTRDIFLQKGQDTTIYIHFPKMVKINSVPYHAKLTLDDQFIGLTPATLEYETYRGKKFLLEKSGYKPATFVLENDKPQFYTLEPLVLNRNEEEKHSFSHSLFQSNLKTKFLFLTGTVVTHWLAFYLKNEADDNFEKYSVTGNPVLMKKYWDNTQKYDRWSDISLGVSYALLGGLIYTVIK
ncbi:MAG: hypothetical protein JXL67_04700 [Calditrichaeota bacterium]|nr:hypothetical protein [Calditrichota bacterium]